MITVIFEVEIHQGKQSEYLDLAEKLAQHLKSIKGFISIERFSSLKNEGKILSLSFWEDEEAVKQWRKLDIHRATQAKGRQSIFKDYRLRIGKITRDYGLEDRLQAPIDSKEYHLK